MFKIIFYSFIGFFSFGLVLLPLSALAQTYGYSGYPNGYGGGQGYTGYGYGYPGYYGYGAGYSAVYNPCLGARLGYNQPLSQDLSCNRNIYSNRPSSYFLLPFYNYEPISFSLTNKRPSIPFPYYLPGYQQRGSYDGSF